MNRDFSTAELEYLATSKAPLFGVDGAIGQLAAFALALHRANSDLSAGTIARDAKIAQDALLSGALVRRLEWVEAVLRSIKETAELWHRLALASVNETVSQGVLMLASANTILSKIEQANLPNATMEKPASDRLAQVERENKDLVSRLGQLERENKISDQDSLNLRRWLNDVCDALKLPGCPSYSALAGHIESLMRDRERLSARVTAQAAAIDRVIASARSALPEPEGGTETGEAGEP